MSALSDGSVKSSVVLDRELDAAMSGIRSIWEECVRCASISGLRPSASPAPAGRRIPIGIRSHETFEASV